jgi:hypothetical protein
VEDAAIKEADDAVAAGQRPVGAVHVPIAKPEVELPVLARRARIQIGRHSSTTIPIVVGWFMDVG